MPDRALIIAVEQYRAATEGLTAKELPGTLAAAQAFRAWLEEKWRGEGSVGDVFFCSEPRIPGERGATKADLLEALIELNSQGQNTTSNLFVYFSGHGFRLKGETLNLADVIVTSDYVDLQRSSDCCWKLDALIQRLRCLGPGCHYYFIDACRNEVARAIGSAIMPTCDVSEDPSVFVLQSTVPGAPALVGGPFARALVKGLQGAGIAKAWRPPIRDSMQVRFDSLLRYLQESLTTTQPIHRHVDGTVHDDEAVLATIKPVPDCALKVVLRTPLAPASGRITLAPFQGPERAEPFTGNSVTLALRPDHYTVAVTVPGCTVVPVQVDVRLYEDVDATFDVKPAAPGPPPSAPPVGPPPPPPAPPAAPPPPAPPGPAGGPAGGPMGMLRVSVPPGASVEIHHVTLGLESVFNESAAAVLPAGTYGVRMRGRDGRVVRRDEVVVGPEQPTDVAPGDWRGSVPLESLAARLPHSNGGVDFSEELDGEVTDPDPAVWLAIVGAGRVLGSTRDYSKIGPLPLADFSAEAPGASPTYLLAGIEDSAVPLRAALHGPAYEAGRQNVLDVRESGQLRGVREAVVPAPPGQRFLTLFVGDQPALTVASFASPNRCTLVVLTLDESQQPRVAQYLVPFGHLMNFLDPRVKQNIEERRAFRGIGPLKDVYQLSLMHRAFRRRRDLAKEFGQEVFEELLYGKWIDPIGASLATYECVRRNQRQYLPVVASNMEQFFPDLPDTPAIQTLAGLPAERRGVPLFIDGLRVFGIERLALPFGAALLDFSSPWTTWRGAV